MPTDSPTLYDRLGGEAGIASLVDKFYDRVVADLRLSKFFEHAPVDRIRAMQREFFAAALGGPQMYSGMSLFKSHAGKHIQPLDFSRFVQLLLETLREIGVNEADVASVVDKIAVYAGDVVSDSEVAE